MKIKKSFWLLYLAIFAVSCTTPEVITIPLSEGVDVTMAVQNAIKKIGNGSNVIIKFEKGEYNFYPEKAIEKYCYISNHNDAMTPIAFDLENLKGITIDGGGADLVFHGRMIPFLINNSRDVVVKNLSVDFKYPFHSEGLIVANDENANTFDLKISEGYPYEIRDKQLIFVKPYYEHTLGQSILYDPEHKGIAYQTEHYTSLTTLANAEVSTKKDLFDYIYKKDKNDDYIRDRGRQNQLCVEELQPGLVRVYNHRKKLPPVGMVLVSKGEQWDNRLTPAFKLDDVTNFYAEDVTIYHAGGMGYICENCEDLELNRCHVIPAEGRMVSTTADATHFVGCRGMVTLRDCVLQSQLDDASNVHGTYQEVMDVIDNRTLGMRVGHYQQQGFRLAKPGDEVGLVRLSDSFDAYHKLTVKTTEKINGRYHIITLKEDLPSGVKEGDLLENLSAYPDLFIEGCDISRNRARGLLLSTPRSTVIRNCFFRTEMEALLLPVESSNWFESGNATNVIIEGNTFQDCTAGGMNRGVIRFHTDDKSPNVAFEDITIRNNTFNQFDNWILEISNVDGLIFEDNIITNSGTYPQQFPNDPVVTINNSSNIKLKGNQYKGRATQMVNMQDGSTEVEFL